MRIFICLFTAFVLSGCSAHIKQDELSELSQSPGSYIEVGSGTGIFWEDVKDDINSNSAAFDAAIAAKQDYDLDLADLADGELTGSKVGPGISGSNINTGTVADDRIASTIARDSEVTTAVASKQDTLVSGTNIKTVNSTSLLGSGDIVISGGASAAEDVSFTPAGNISSTDSQAAIEELDTEKANVDGSALVGNLADHGVYHTTGVVATSIATSDDCIIATIGTTDFTSIGASANTVGVRFTATGVGSGTGTVNLILPLIVDDPDTVVDSAKQGITKGGVQDMLAVIASGITEQASDPTASSMSTGDFIASIASGDLFFKSSTGLYTISGTYAADPTYPTVTAIALDSTGTAVDVTLSEVLDIGTGGSDTLILNCATAGSSLATTYNSGDGTTSFSYDLDTATIYNNDVCTATYSQPGDGLEDSAGDDLQSFSGTSVDVSAAPSATSGSTLAINDSTATATIALSSSLGSAKGQSFLTTAAGNLSTLKLYVASYSGTTSVKCRVGETDTLTTYLEEATSQTITGTGELDIAFTGTTALSNATTYYFGCVYLGTAVSLDNEGTGTYSGGSIIYASGTSWTLTSSTGGDLIFEVVGD